MDPVTKANLLQYHRQRFDSELSVIRSIIDEDSFDHTGFSNLTFVTRLMHSSEPDYMIRPDASTPVLRALHGAYLDLRSASVSLQLTNFISTVLLPRTGIATPTDFIMESDIKYRGSGYCTEAEPYLVRAHNQAIQPDGAPVAHNKISVYHAADGTPVLLRKQHSESTALTLAPILACGMPVLPGTIVTLSPATKTEITGETQVQSNGETLHMATYLLPPKIAIEVGRLSAWAFAQPFDRALFAVSHAPGYEKFVSPVAQDLIDLSLKDFQTAAQCIMEYCGVSK